MAYHDNQPFDGNMLRPCPMLENPERLRAMVKETGAKSTDYESPKEVDTLCDPHNPLRRDLAAHGRPALDRKSGQAGRLKGHPTDGQPPALP